MPYIGKSLKGREAVAERPGWEHGLYIGRIAWVVLAAVISGRSC